MKYYYGISKKTVGNGKCEGYVTVFKKKEDLINWIDTEERDFREREEITREQAIDWEGERNINFMEVIASYEE